MNNQQRRQQQISEIQQQWELLSEQLSALYREKILETRAEEKFRLEHVIAQKEAERKQIEQQLKTLETQNFPKELDNPLDQENIDARQDISSTFQSSLVEVKRNALEKLRADLYNRYEAAYAQLMSELNEANKIPLQNQIKQIEQQIQEIEQQLHQLETNDITE